MLRGKGPSLRQIDGNVYSEKVPGGNLISAVLDRQLMGWSDRGGASRYFGDRWSDACTQALDGWTGSDHPLPGGSMLVETVVRLDENPRIAIQAGRHKLTNPDFILYGRSTDDEPALRAADAKFAVDTIRPGQVSPEALRALLDVEHGLVQAAIEATLGTAIPDEVRIGAGFFLSPISPLTDYFLPRLLSSHKISVRPDQVVLLPADPVELFGGLPISPSMGALARIDRLPVSPRTNLLAAMYYVRLACSCAWMWTEERTPLLSLEPAHPPTPDELAAEVRSRALGATAAFELVEAWFADVERVMQSRRALADVAAVPVRMKEIREMAEQAGLAEDRRLVRRVRAALDQRYRQRLVEEVGEIPAAPREPLTEVLSQVAKASRGMRREFRSLAEQLIASGGSGAELFDGLTTDDGESAADV